MRTYTKSSQNRSNNGRSDNKRQDSSRDHHRDNHNRDHTKSNGRGNPRELHQKYLTLAREAIQSGDIIEAEQHFQHAEHYYRVMAERSSYHQAPQTSVPKPVERAPEPIPPAPTPETLFSSPNINIETPVSQPVACN